MAILSLELKHRIHTKVMKVRIGQKIDFARINLKLHRD